MRNPSENYPCTTTVRMPTTLLDAAKERAEEEERSVAQLIRHACRQYLKTPVR